MAAAPRHPLAVALDLTPAQEARLAALVAALGVATPVTAPAHAASPPTPVTWLAPTACRRARMLMLPYTSAGEVLLERPRAVDAPCGPLSIPVLHYIAPRATLTSERRVVEVGGLVYSVHYALVPASDAAKWQSDVNLHMADRLFAVSFAVLRELATGRPARLAAVGSGERIEVNGLAEPLRSLVADAAFVADLERVVVTTTEFLAPQ